MRLLLAFILIPCAEMYILVRLGSALGILTTFALIFGTAIVGASLTRLEGWRTLSRIQAALAQDMMPADEMVDGVLIFAAGLVLITPGFLTDALGFALLIPTTRRLIKRSLWRRFHHMIDQGNVRVVVSDIQDF